MLVRRRRRRSGAAPVPAPGRDSRDREMVAGPISRMPLHEELIRQPGDQRVVPVTTGNAVVAGEKPAAGDGHVVTPAGGRRANAPSQPPTIVTFAMSTSSLTKRTAVSRPEGHVSDRNRQQSRTRNADRACVPRQSGRNPVAIGDPRPATPASSAFSATIRPRCHFSRPGSMSGGVGCR
jgi:hypothetical protein